MKTEKKIRERVHYDNVRAMIEDVGDRFADRNAYSFKRNPRDKEVIKKTYPELRDDVRSLATRFVELGYAGKKIVAIAKFTYEWVLCYYAALCTGSVFIPLDREWKGDDLAATVEKAEGDVIFYDQDIEAKVALVAEAVSAARTSAGDEEAKVEAISLNNIGGMVIDGRATFAVDSSLYYGAPIDEDAMSLLVFTSGTTGKGKGVMLSQRAITWDLEDVVCYIGFSKKTIGVLPPHHTYGSTVGVYGQNSVGIEIYISSGIAHVLRELNAEKPGHLVLVPLYLETFYRRIQANLREKGKLKLVNRMIKLSNFLRKLGIDLRRKLFRQVLDAFGGELHHVISGGAPINHDIANFFDAIGITVLNGYGITECAPLIAVNHTQRIVPGTVGFPIDGDIIRIDEPNEEGEGEICVKGPNVMLGYFKDDEATAEAMTEDGFFRTGDYGKITREGAIAITGRKKNLIILSNGKNVYPEEIESEFTAVPYLLDIIVYEGKSKRGMAYDAIVAEIFPDYEQLEKNGVTDPQAYFQSFIDTYNKTAVSYKKIAILKVRTEDFPKNTLRKIMRFKLDTTID